MRFRRDKGGVRTKMEGVDHLWLRLRNDKQVITGYHSFDGENWIREDWGMEISGFNHNTFHDFQSMLPGLAAIGEGSVTFSNFKYRSLTDE